MEIVAKFRLRFLQIFVPVLAVFLCLIGLRSACAQSSSDDEKQTGAVDIGIRDENGNFLPIPNSRLTAEEFQKLLRQIRAGKPLSSFELASLKIEGAVEGDHARLEIRVVIEVRTDDQQIRVPLGLREATPTDPASHEGSGEARFDLETHARTGELGWFLTGRGRHTLTIPVVVPIRQPVHSQRRLRLTLPEAASNQVQFSIPGKGIKLTPPSAGAWRVKQEDDASAVQIWGAGRALDLQWSLVLPVESKPTINVNTRFVSDLTAAPVDLVAVQTITARTGSFDSLRVKLPDGINLFDLEELSENATDRLLDDYQVDKKSRMVSISLREPCKDSLQLRWLLDPVSHIIPGKVSFSSFKVENARVHTGQVEIIASEGFQLERIDAKDIRRTRVLSRIQENQVATAWRFRTDEFRLTLDVNEYEPRFTVSPEFRMATNDDTLTLDAQLTCRVFRGSPRELVLNWPGYADEQWTIQSPALDPSLNAPGWEIASREGDRLVLRLLDRPAARDFQVRFQAFRPADPESPVDFRLPRVELPENAPKPLVTTVIFRESENSETELTARNATTLLPLNLSNNDEQSGRRLRGWRVTSSEHALRAEVTRHERVLDVSTKIVASVDGDQITIEQQLDHNVQYGSSTEVGLQFPESVDTPVELLFDGQPLGISPAAPLQRIPLPDVQTGAFSIVARYGIRIPDRGRADFARLTIPLITSADGEFSSIRVDLDQSGATELLLADESEWRPLFSPSEMLSFQSDEHTQEFGLRAGGSSSISGQRLSVRRALIRTVLDGEARSRMLIEFEQAPEEIPLTLAADCECLASWWNGVPIQPIVRATEGDEQSLLFRIPKSMPDPAVLTLDFRSYSADTGVLVAQHQIQPPALPDEIWARELVWEVRTPPGQLLFDFSRTFTPRYDWFFNGLYWGRRPKERINTLSSWFPDRVPGFPSEAALEQFPAYPLGRYGVPAALEISTIDRGTLVLAVAGTALLLGFVLFSVSFGWSLITLAVLAIGLGVVTIFQPYAVELMLQPIGLGVVFSLLARWLTGQLYGDRLKTDPANEFALHPTTQRVPLNPAGPDDPTEVRTRPIASESRMAGVDSRL